MPSEITSSEFVQYRKDIDTGYLVDLLDIPASRGATIGINVYEAVRLADESVLIQDSTGVGQSWTKNRDDAEVYLHGTIRWDGCSDWSFYPADNCMIHLCGPGDADELHWLLKTCYSLVADAMPDAQFGRRPSPDRRR